LAKEAIRRLRDDKIEPSLDEIVWLHELAEKTEKSFDPILFLFSCKKIGRLTIYPMTIGARIWMISTALKWFDGDELMTDLSILYAYCNSRTLQAFEFKTPKEARTAIYNWAKNLNVTEEEILDSFKEIAPEENLDAQSLLYDIIGQIKENPLSLDLSKAMIYLNKKNDVTKKDGHWISGYIAVLMHYYPGKTEEAWLWDTPEEIFMEMLNKISDFEKTDDKKIDPNDPSIIAYNQFQKAVKQIRSGYGRRTEF
jgi:hypothetical protein